MPSWPPASPTSRWRRHGSPRGALRTVGSVHGRWADVETSWGGLGSGEVRILPVDGGGTRIEVQWTTGSASRMRDRVLLWLLHRAPMYRVIARLWRKTLDEYAGP